MPLLFWDASALGKRYATESGSATANSLWASGSEMAATIWGYAEVYAMLVRRLNSGSIDNRTFTAQVASLQNEVLTDPQFTLLSIYDAAVLQSLSFIKIYSLNSTDAAILSVFLNYRKNQMVTSTRHIVLVASDRRLLRAANAEGVFTINPEMVSPVDVRGILSSL